ncbi:MAG: hypothetical protein K2X93_16705 [Candidatus Obscuribacterales bacterium]|nr:hypothetical protein [Candidatus Obscuribacterales bacterium]
MKTNTRLGSARALRETFLSKMAQVVAHNSPSMTDEEARLGQLLVGTGNLTDKALAASLDIARTVRLPLGVVLLMNGLVNPETIDRAIQLQQLIHRGLSPSIARIIMRYATIADVTTDEALEDFSMDPEMSALDCWLIQVITACDILTFEQVEDIDRRATSANSSWARYAAEQNIVSIDVLSAAMHAVVLMDLNHLSYGDAVALVRAVSTKASAMQVLLRVHMPKHTFDASTLNLPALLYAAEVISERNALDLLSLSYKQRTNPVALIEQNYLLSDNQFELAVNITSLLNKGLAPSSAIAKLKSHEMRCPERSMLAKWQVACA